MLPTVSMTKEFCHPDERRDLGEAILFKSGKMLPTVSMTKEFCHPDERRDLGEAKNI